ncbi:MAG: UDP-N-acetylmuramoyl-L-alanine--D-glutamate ligase [Firmicutes bacterium]|nr:UDP-N-acetylmuramoyl-L-alanine--D-glutamate ligase [[Eubacterium] siraeum]MCM1487099.1 UDP-N-acetylmuramoyl-L-alanine--D-glutamate ligase [Bacillota bacterium]
MKEKLKAFFENKKVLILGFGREGRSTLELIKDFDCEIGISDQNPNITDDIKRYKLYCGKNYLDAIKDYDIVMKTPGIALLDKISAEDKEKITGQTDLFLRFCPNYTIGVTGTKGKSTVSSLIVHILNYCGKNAVLIGNIGIPPLSAVDALRQDTTVVMEMSCHQLEYIKASPKTALLLNVYEEHLDHYVDFNAYKAAKENIYRYQSSSSLLIYNKDLQDREIASLPSKKITASMDEKADIYIDDNGIFIEGQRISCEMLAPKLEGKHNLYNIAAALCAVLHQGCDLDKAIEAVSSFNGLEHRMEFVRLVNGVKFINDSISTIPLATINAVNTFNADTVIIGGMDRGINYDILVDFFNRGNVENIICLPYSGYRIADMLNDRANVYKVKDLEEAVQKAYEAAKHCCVLSPAAASYGFYKNFEERGRHFKELVNKL